MISISKKTGLIVLTIVLVYALLVAWPLRALLAQPSWLWQENLALFFNESEARPCGGFLTAYGTFRILPPRYELHNGYHFGNQDFGKNAMPLQKVSERLYFWDLGKDPNPKICTQTFAQSYGLKTGQEPDSVWLINFSSIERLFALVAPLEIGGEVYTKDNFFATTTRSVADIDRHNEIVLQERKRPLSLIAKAMIKELLWHPIKAHRAARILADEIASGSLYHADFSPQPKLDGALSLIEWNLGGAKSSRYLDKALRLRLRQKEDQSWEGVLDLRVEHLGSYDEPLSQDYKGTLQLSFPETLKKASDEIDLSLRPGALFEKSYPLGSITHLESLGFFAPRGQSFALDIALTAYPQQTWDQESKALTSNIKENLWTFRGAVQYPGKDFALLLQKDDISPFLTLHEVVNVENLSPQNQAFFVENSLILELHFNEKIQHANDLIASLRDTNHHNEDTDHPVFKKALLLEDQKTMLLGFSQTVEQKNERFTLSLEGLEDRWGHPLKGLDRWTVIPR